MCSLDDRLRSRHTSHSKWHVLKYLYHQFPRSIDIDSMDFAEFIDDSGFITAVETLRDEGLILYEQFIRTGVSPSLYIMVSLSIKGERLIRKYSQLI